MKSASKQPLRKSRKQIRKEQRKEKKLKRSVQNFRKNGQTNSTVTSGHISDNKKTMESSLKKQTSPINTELVRDNEKKKQEKLKSQMVESRKKQLIAANEDEDRNIRQLEKLLHLNRRKGSKAKSLPKSFADDGLGYLLEVCDSDMIKDTVKMDQALQDSGSEFEEDFAVVRGTNKSKIRKPSKKTATRTREPISDTGSDEDSGDDFGLGVDDGSDEAMSVDAEEQASLASEDEMLSDTEEHLFIRSNSEMSEDSDTETSMVISKYSKDSSSQLDNVPQEMESKAQSKPGKKKNVAVNVKKKEDISNHLSKYKTNSKDSHDTIRESDNYSSDAFEDSNDDNGNDESITDQKSEKNSNGIWEDIYGRTRDKDGNVIDEKPGKYVPPALRAKMEGNEDVKRKENLARLHKQMKGLINRLAENNMASICSQIDELFMKNSRHDMNETLLNLILDALVCHALTPERLVMEHMLLIAVLHANVGTEVGAHFLQYMMKKFNDMLELLPEVENKELDNVVLILSHLYNFKVFSASLMYEVLDKISETLNEKRIELILVILRSVGFSLRKDDPMALKSLILKLQGKAVDCSFASSTSSRVKFMLDILMAIKNNNMSKIPSYNPEHVEHLKKLLRTLVRRGNYVTELKITLDDILKAEERGRWWIVGSAWTGHLPGENPSQGKTLLPIDSSKPGKSSDMAYSLQLLELARKQRMNTGVRKDIFCILMTSEDFMDAFEKLLHLNLKTQQRQEIVHVVFDCCLQEKTFNPYYAHIAQKFCDFDRQYQMKFQYNLWDKLKELDKLHSTQLSNLAKLLAHLFLEKGLPLSALKVISFAEMDKPCVRLIRQIILIILLTEDQSRCEAVFHRIALSPQLHLFREGLRLFINHFVLRKGSKKSLPEQDFALLKDRARTVDKALSSADARMEF